MPNKYTDLHPEHRKQLRQSGEMKPRRDPPPKTRADKRVEVPESRVRDVSASSGTERFFKRFGDHNFSR